MSLKHVLVNAGITVGADPEFFFLKKGALVGSEEVIPKEGMSITCFRGEMKVVRDGVQAELHPTPNHCRVVFVQQLGKVIVALQEYLKADRKLASYYPSFSPGVVEVSEEVMEKLSQESRKLGCDPSLNIYEPDLQPAAAVDGATYRIRACGGHLHMGLSSSDARWRFAKEGKSIDRYTEKFAAGRMASSYYDVIDRLVAVCDVLVGNTCVLLDRDPLQVERRKVYGRAGEYRIPPHGVEYRTLSNFWLRSPILAHFVTGLAKMSVSTVLGGLLTEQGRKEYGVSSADNPMDDLLNDLEPGDFQRAINQNDFDLAWRNFKRIKPWLKKWSPEWYTRLNSNWSEEGGFTVVYKAVGPQTNHIFPLTHHTLDKFEAFIERGIDHYFPAKEALKAWGAVSVNFVGGWEQFISNVHLKKGEK